MDRVDVLIVGAGPTGLTLAIECMRYNLSCKIIDQAPGPTTYSKAIAVQARTLEVFQRMGIHERFLAAGIHIKASNIHFRHQKCVRLNLQNIASPFPFVLSLEQSKTEQILIDYLAELGCLVERSTPLLSYEEKEGSVFARTDKGIIQAKYLVGCDGAHSVVRKTMGCTFEGKTFSDVFSLADVEISWDRPPDELQVFFESDEIMAVFPMPEKNRYRLIFQLKRLRGLLRAGRPIDHGIISSDEIASPTLSEIEQLLASHTQEATPISNPRWVANFHINSRLSNRYRKNNVFLAGDAAHIHSPVGGQGMNTGIQDAFNLGWKIAYVHKQISGSALLDTYEEERRGLGKKLLKGTEKASTVVTLHLPGLRRILNCLLSFLLPFKTVQKRLASAISEINIRYVYKRVPNLTLLGEGGEVGFFTLTEKSKEFHLLLFNVDKSPIDHPHVRAYRVKTDSPPKALLVRPDGYLAVEDHPPFKKLIAYRI